RAAADGAGLGSLRPSGRLRRRRRRRLGDGRPVAFGWRRDQLSELSGLGRGAALGDADRRLPDDDLPRPPRAADPLPPGPIREREPARGRCPPLRPRSLALASPAAVWDLEPVPTGVSHQTSANRP